MASAKTRNVKTGEELSFWFSFPTHGLWPTHRSLQPLDPKQRALTLRGSSLRGARVRLMLQKIKTRQSRGALSAALLQLSNAAQTLSRSGICLTHVKIQGF